MPVSAVASGGESHDISGATSPDHPSVLNQGAENNPAEQASVSAQAPNWFAFLYTQFMFLNAFAWTSDQRPGTVIWKIPLHPLFMNEIIIHFAEIFNLWAGSFDFKLLIAGTGFLGGKIAIVWIPPNKDLDTMTLQDKTVFSFAIVDPKENEPIHFTARDMRIQKAHWMNYDTKIDYTKPDANQLENYAKLGGYLAIVVVNALVNSTQTGASANISVFNKLGADFAFNQFVPPTRIESGPGSGTLPDFTFDEYEVCPQWANWRLTTMNIGTVVTTTSVDCSCLVSPTRGHYSRRPSAWRFHNCGVLDDRFDENQSFSNQATYVDTPKWDLPNPDKTGDGTTFCNFNAIMTNNPSNYLFHIVNAVNDTHLNNLSFYTKTDVAAGKEFARVALKYPTITIGDPTALGSLYDWRDGRDKDAEVKFGTLTTGEVPSPDYTITSDIGESIVSFGSSTDPEAVGMPVTRRLSDWFFSAPVKITGQDPIFDVIDVASELPLVTLRLNADGYFTASKASSIKRFQLKKILLRHTGYLDHHAQLPKPTASNNAAFQLRELILRNAILEDERERRYRNYYENMCDSPTELPLSECADESDDVLS